MHNYNQCNGTTQKGLRCKKQVQERGGYCHYHIRQSGQSATFNSDSKHKPTIGYNFNETYTKKPGYIYVYTLTSLLGLNSLWLKVRNIPNTAKKDKNKWVEFDAQKQEYMLIKVGMTTKTVTKRLKQWQDQCHHNLTCLYPGLISPAKKGMSSLIEKLKRLHIKKEEQYHYRTLRKADMGFYASGDVSDAETEIHKVFRKKYGNGDVLCTGCKKNQTLVSEVENYKKLLDFFKRGKHKDESFQEGTYNIHVEWFLIPKQDLHYVYKVIDSVCLQN